MSQRGAGSSKKLTYSSLRFSTTSKSVISGLHSKIDALRVHPLHVSYKTHFDINIKLILIYSKDTCADAKVRQRIASLSVFLSPSLTHITHIVHTHTHTHTYIHVHTCTTRKKLWVDCIHTPSRRCRCNIAFNKMHATIASTQFEIHGPVCNFGRPCCRCLLPNMSHGSVSRATF